MEQQAKAQGKQTYFAEERKRIIMEILMEHQKISIPELCTKFSISPVTIRNDLNELQKSGLLKRIHGGAILNRQVAEENIVVNDVPNLKSKTALAECALSLIEDGDTILLDTGSTMLELAKLLNRRERLTIVVNDIQIAAYLEKNTSATIIVLGGVLRRGLHCTVGPAANRMLEGLKVDKAFIGTNGLTLEGLSTPDVYQADIKQKMISIANHTIVMADSSKLGTQAFQRFATINDFDTLLTNSNADQDFVGRLREGGNEVIMVD